MPEKLCEPKLGEILDFCAEAPVERVLLEDMARRRLGAFRALKRGRQLTALCHAGVNVVPAGDGCAAFASLLSRDRARMVLGEDRAVSGLWSAACAHMPEPRADRPGQPVFVLEKPPSAGDSGLRPAREDDLERLLPACAAAHRQELGVDPLARDAEAFRARTRAQIVEGRSWLWLEGDVILFKAEASALTPCAVQLQQVWTDPAARRQGCASRGLRDLCRALLACSSAVCLFVRTENEAAIRLYETIGMRRAGSYRSLLF